MANPVTDPSLLAKLNGAPAPVTDPAILAKLNGGNAPAVPNPQDLADKEFDAQPWYDRALIGAGGQVVNGWNGLKQMGAEAGNKLGIVSDKTVADIQKQVDDAAPFQAASTRGGWGKVGGLVPYGVGSVLSGGGLNAVGLGEFAATHPYLMAGLGGAVQNAIGGMPTGSSRLLNAGIGAGAGILGEGLSGVIGRGANMAMGKISPYADAILNYAKQNGIKLSTGDLGSQGMRQVETIASHLPFTGQAEAQAAKASAIHSAAQDIPAQMAPYTAMRIAESQQPGDVLAQAIRDNYGRVSQQAADLYKGLDTSGAPPVMTPNTASAVADATKEYPDIFQKGSADLPQSTQATLAAISQGKPVPFSDLHYARSAVLAAKRNLGDGHAFRAKMLSQIHSAIDQDMDSWGANGQADALDAYRGAQDFYRNNVVPFHAKEVDPILSPSYNSESLAAKVSPGAHTTVERLANAGGDEGKDALRYIIANNPVNAATSGDGFSVPKFANAAAKVYNSPAAAKVFTPEELQSLRVSAEVARLAKRAGVSTNDMHTGAQLLPFAEAAGLHETTGSVKGTLASMAGVGAALRGVTGAARSAPVARYFMTPRELPGLLPWMMRGAAVGATRPFIAANQAPAIPFALAGAGQ